MKKKKNILNFTESTTKIDLFILCVLLPCVVTNLKTQQPHKN